MAAGRRARSANDSRSIVRLSGEFHILLAEMAGNALLAKEHAELVDALARAMRRAMKLMIHHLNHVEENLDLTVAEPGPVDLESALA